MISNMKHIYISLIHFNNNEDTIACLESLENVKKKDFSLSVLVLDNGSSEVFVSLLKPKNYTLTIVRSDVNKGFSGGHNDNITQALQGGASHICILNNDTTLDPNFLHELLAVCETHPAAGIVVPKIYFAKGSEYHKDRYKKDELGKVLWYGGGNMDWQNVISYHRGVDEVDTGQYDHIAETEIATGCCMFVKREVFERVGVFDDRYFLYYEDADLSIRVKRKNYTIVFVPTAHVWHGNARSTGGAGSALQDYYISRNRLLFGMLYAPIRAKIALVREGMTLLSQGRPWQKKGVKDFFLRRFGKGSYGV